MEKEILNAMKKVGKPLRISDVDKLIGRENKEVSKVMDSQKKKGRITSPKHCYWEPA